MPFPALNHVALTVSDLDRSTEWYSRLFGGEPVASGEEASYRYVIWIEPLVGLHEHRRPDNSRTFSETCPGLDHISFGCSSRSDLEQWKQRLDELGIEHGEVVDAPYGSGLAFRDPDNIALEFFCLPS